MMSSTPACGHWEAARQGFSGHCSHGSCPNYMDACPQHRDYGMAPGPGPGRFEDRSGKPCTLTHYQDGETWHRKHDVFGGPHDEPPAKAK
jgi:hypothetical protein